MAKIQKIMQDEGVVIQPYWRSLYRHYKSNVQGAEMHPSFEMHVHDYAVVVIRDLRRAAIVAALFA